jgi:hypothetical protein
VCKTILKGQTTYAHVNAYVRLVDSQSSINIKVEKRPDPTSPCRVRYGISSLTDMASRAYQHC